MRGPDGERGAVIVAFILKIALSLAVLGLAFFEGGQIVIAQVKAQGAARAAAEAAAGTYHVTKNASLAHASAVEAARGKDPRARVIEVRIAGDGGVDVTASDVARTVLVQRIGFLRHFVVQRATEHGEYAP